MKTIYIGTFSIPIALSEVICSLGVHLHFLCYKCSCYDKIWPKFELIALVIISVLTNNFTFEFALFTPALISRS